jgi:predicted transcriptional regulator|tara:strand:- start:5030 stop:5464 length:435 start_codon:yes stop_codon:yes gene_type:complete
MTEQKRSLLHRLGIHPRRAPHLGERELAVMNLLWRGQSLSATQLLDAMPTADIGLSTVQSTLERLYRKGLVSREKEARAFVYRHSIEREELIRALLRDITQDIAGGDLLPVISGFARYVAEDDTATASAIAALLTREGKAADEY